MRNQGAACALLSENAALLHGEKRRRRNETHAICTPSCMSWNVHVWAHCYYVVIIAVSITAVNGKALMHRSYSN